jgi:tetratricopeptide (TPR) repeat protein
MFGKGIRNFTLGALAILIATLAVYMPAMQGGFVWDDDAYVTQNVNLRDVAGLQKIWLHPTSPSQSIPVQYYPVVHTLFGLEHHLGGGRAIGYHVVNVLLHALNAILLWILLRRLALPGALLAASIFALHPVHVESVAWITELKNVLSASLYLLSALAYLRFSNLDGCNPSSRGKWVAYVLALVLFVLALLSKTVTATLPVVLALVIWWKRGRLTRGDVAALVPMLALGFAFGLLTVYLERTHVGASGALWSLTFPQRVLVAGRALGFYIGKLVVPVNLTFIYPRWTIDAGAWWQYLFPASVFLFAYTLWSDRERLGRGPFTALACFIVTLFPALGFFNVFPMLYSFVADHFQYLASAGLIALISAALASTLKRPAFVAVSCAILLALGALTWRQGGVYKDLETLWRDTLSKNPSCWMAHVNLGKMLSLRGDSAEAVLHYQQALMIWPGDAGARNNLAIELANAGQMDAAIGQLQEAIRLWPGYVDARCNMAIFLTGQGRTQEAIAQYRQVLQIRPDHALARENLNRLLSESGTR